MHNVTVLRALLKINIQQELAYRVDTIVNILTNLMWLVWELVGLSIIFSNTSTIDGWTLGDLLVLLGVFHILATFMQGIVWPNTEKFNQGVREGTLDYVFLLPVSSQFMVSFSRMIIWNAWNLLVGVVLIVVGIYFSGENPPTPANLVTFLILLVSGGLIIYSLWIALIALTFWFTKFDNNVTLMQALMDTGRYPSVVYPFWLQVLVTFIIPIALATTIPIEALRGNLEGWQILLAFGAGVLALFLSSRLWQAGVRRYSGASS